MEEEELLFKWTSSSSKQAWFRDALLFLQSCQGEHWWCQHFQGNCCKTQGSWLAAINHFQPFIFYSAAAFRFLSCSVARQRTGSFVRGRDTFQESWTVDKHKCKRCWWIISCLLENTRACPCLLHAVTYHLAELLRYHDKPQVRAIWTQMSQQFAGCAACTNSYYQAKVRKAPPPLCFIACHNERSLRVLPRCLATTPSSLPPSSTQVLYAEEFEPEAVAPMLSGMQLLDAERLLGWLSFGASPLPVGQDPPPQVHTGRLWVQVLSWFPGRRRLDASWDSAECFLLRGGVGE